MCSRKKNGTNKVDQFCSLAVDHVNSTYSSTDPARGFFDLFIA